MEVIVGPWVTVNPFVKVAPVVSGFVTVTSRDVVAAVLLMEMLAVSCPPPTNAVELTVIPVPENDTTAPLKNPEPFTVMSRFVAP